ncbi:serine hydrolase domain-containing protein [Luteimicrobium subarcticum]|uniref:CubicO group peptidase (Beta-lactamase class C family) n=1 Tax=Luteimicrobium subarcticum TaxID=620910 RepID=A0A2M8WJJ4_9MICO|nr:serine hydrolase [Luteimicrobium subarcticum]PJI91107.1 CubicO group peptidase (beta-lactamase class C family) [Luteimicrobium subarcticum]
MTSSTTPTAPRKLTRARKLLLAAAIVLVVVIGGAVAAYWYERPMLLTGTGYAAHNACALHEIAGRDDASDDLPPNPLVPVLRSEITDDGTAAKASILGVLAPQKAWANPGYGCTVADKPPTGLPSPTTVSAANNPYTSLPLTTSTDDAVTAALADGFGDDLAADDRADLGTRGVVVLQDGKLVAERYADGFSATTPQLGWSMTKSVTNLLVGRLVEQGKVGLDDDHLRPEWTDDRADITIRELMQMTSGLSWDETYDLGTPITQMLYGEPDMAGYVASQKLAHTPGSYLQYSSGSTTLLCSVVTQDDGGADAPRREVFAPLGLSSATLEVDGVGTPVCGSYMWATPRDWATVGELALQDGVWDGTKLLPTGWMAQSTQAVDTTVEEGSDGYASGWWSNTRADGSVIDDRLPADTYYADGHDGQYVIVVPSQKLVVARLGFTPTRDDDRVMTMTSELVDALG